MQLARLLMLDGGLCCGMVVQHQAGSVAGVAWSPDGRRLATGSADACVRVWEAGSGTCTATLQVGGQRYGVGPGRGLLSR